MALCPHLPLLWSRCPNMHHCPALRLNALACISRFSSFSICTWQQNDFPSWTFYISCQKLGACSCFSRVSATKATADIFSLFLAVCFSAWTPSPKLHQLANTLKSVTYLSVFSSNPWLCTKNLYKHSHLLLDNSVHQTALCHSLSR